MSEGRSQVEAEDDAEIQAIAAFLEGGAEPELGPIETEPVYISPVPNHALTQFLEQHLNPQDITRRYPDVVQSSHLEINLPEAELPVYPSTPELEYFTPPQSTVIKGVEKLEDLLIQRNLALLFTGVRIYLNNIAQQARAIVELPGRLMPVNLGARQVPVESADLSTQGI